MSLARRVGWDAKGCHVLCISYLTQVKSKLTKTLRSPPSRGRLQDTSPQRYADTRVGSPWPKTR